MPARAIVPQSSAVVVAALVTLFSAHAAFAENNNPSRARIDYDPITGQPTCTIVSSSDPTVVPGTKFTCPPSVTPRTPTTTNTGTTTTGTTSTSTTGSSETSHENTGGTTPTTNTTTRDGTTPTTTTTTTPTNVVRPAVVIAGAYTGASDSFSILRFANVGTTGGKAQVTFVNPSDGKNLATWSSAEIPAHGALQINVSDIAAAATIEPNVTVLPTTANLRVSSAFGGSVQHLIGSMTSGVVTDASACGRAITVSRERIGYVPADATVTQSWVRIVNTGTGAATAALVVRNAATGVALGTWTSPSVASQGSATIGLATILAEANIASGIASFMIDSERLAEGLRLELAVTNAQAKTTVDQTVSCTL